MSVYSPFENLSLEERKIVVGVDFGTTFSGLAWAEERQVIALGGPFRSLSAKFLVEGPG